MLACDLDLKIYESMKTGLVPYVVFYLQVNQQL